MKMKWSGKKSASSSSRASLITRVLPGSWLSKLKQKSGSSDKNSAKMSDSPNAMRHAGLKEGRFYSLDADPYWRLSFGEERNEGRRSTGGISSVWHGSDNSVEVPISGFKSFDLREMELARRKGSPNFNDMVLNIKKMKSSQHEKRIPQEKNAYRSRKTNGEADCMTPRRKAMNDQNARRLSRRVLRAKRSELGGWPETEDEKCPEVVEKDIFEIEPETKIRTKQENSHKSKVTDSRYQQGFSFSNLSLSSIDDHSSIQAPKQTAHVPLRGEWQTLDGKKIKDINVKTETQRTSMHTSRTRQNGKIKAYSPRTECKIRALEDMKKARMKVKKNTKEKKVDGATVFHSFAVVKSSFDPQQDFRDSMVEMITEKGITRPDELEELLACYLTLNCDEYHDLIIKVFRQVWSEMNRFCIDDEKQRGYHFDD